MNKPQSHKLGLNSRNKHTSPSLCRQETITILKKLNKTKVVKTKNSK